jgi:general secretion pathway protein F/type IV pilus assembly protein PilC
MSLSHRRLSSWYQQLAQQLEAGLPLIDAVRSTRGTGLPDAGIEAVAGTMENGGATTAAWNAAERWLPLADRLVLSAAAESGRMPSVLTSLAQRHQQLGAAKFRAALACIYPLLLLHVGLIVLPLTGMIDREKGFTWNPAAYARALTLTLLPLWITLGVLGILIRRQHPVVTRLARMLPFLGNYFRAQGLADFAFGLESFLAAGVRIDRAWALTGSIVNDPPLKRAAAAMHEAMTRGERPGPQLAAWPCFPPDFAALYLTGEASGQLEQNLLRLARQQQDRARRALTLSTLVYPSLGLAAIAAVVIVHVIRFYAGYLQMIEKLAS